MRKFIIRLFLFIFIPVSALALVYFVTDPYKTIRPFSLRYFDTTNRDYLSSELFLLNDPEQHYNSFMFGSSQVSGFNTYHWKSFLPEGSRQFLFQSWSETITGIDQKISFLDARGNDIKNALILLDIPSMFTSKQAPTAALSIKDPRISGQPRWIHQMILLYDFLQKPSQWIKAIRQSVRHTQASVSFDPLSNDWEKNNRDVDFSVPPPKDSLRNTSAISKAAFLKDNESYSDADLVVCSPVIDEGAISKLRHIKEVFDRHDTDYRIIIDPGYCYTTPATNPKDLEQLEHIFGKDKVFNFSGKNDLNSDYNNFSDPVHFGQYVGWHILETVYASDNKAFEEEIQ